MIDMQIQHCLGYTFLSRNRTWCYARDSFILNSIVSYTAL